MKKYIGRLLAKKIIRHVRLLFKHFMILIFFHGDLNRHNMIVSADVVKFIDFEDSISSSDNAPKQKDLDGLMMALTRDIC